MTSSPIAVASRLDRLIESIHPDAEPYTDSKIAEAITAGGASDGTSRQPVPLTVGDLASLRSGRPTKRTDEHLAAIARFYGVTPAYFTDDDIAAEIDQQLRLLVLARDTHVRSITLCHGDQLSLQGMIALLEVAQSIKQEHEDSEDA